MWPYNEHESDWFTETPPDRPAVEPRQPTPEEIQAHIANGKRLQAIAMRAIVAGAWHRLRALVAPGRRRPAPRHAMRRQTA